MASPTRPTRFADEATSRPGDLWAWGLDRLLCSSALDAGPSPRRGCSVHPTSVDWTNSRPRLSKASSPSFALMM